MRVVGLIGAVAMTAFWALWIAGDHGNAGWLHSLGWSIALVALIAIGLAGIVVGWMAHARERRDAHE